MDIKEQVGKMVVSSIYGLSLFEPSMDYVVDIVSDIINNSTNMLPKNIERHIKCSCEHLNTIFTITLLKYASDDHMYLSSRRRIHIIMFQDAPTGNISVSIVNGEAHKQKILYRLISTNPITSIEKYLPTIINSMIEILNKA